MSTKEKKPLNLTTWTGRDLWFKRYLKDKVSFKIYQSHTRCILCGKKWEIQYMGIKYCGWPCKREFEKKLSEEKIDYEKD